MDQPTLNTSGSYSTFIAMCRDLEQHVIEAMAMGDVRDVLVRHLRSLRSELESWPRSPPTTTKRRDVWASMVALHGLAEELMSLEKPLPPETGENP